jgi:hypothetical protein
VSKPCKHATDAAPVCVKCDKSRADDRRKYAANPTPRLERSRRWSTENREKHIERSCKWQKENPDKLSKNRLKRIAKDPEKHLERIRNLQGIKDAHFAKDLEQAQRNHCAVCGRHATQLTGKRRRLCLDHNHDNGQVRGLLCNTCNSGTGITDSVELLRKKIEYLQNPPAVQIGLYPTP